MSIAGHQSNKQRASMDRIMEEVCKEYGVKKNLVLSKSRKGVVVEARKMIHYLAKELTTLPLKEIGKEAGMRDHATVLHSYRTIADFVKIYPYYKDRVELLKSRILRLNGPSTDSK